MSNLTRIERFKAHFGLTRTPEDIGDNYQSFIDFVDSVLRSKNGPLLALYDNLLGQIDGTGLTGEQVIGQLVDLLIVQQWGEEEKAVA